MYICTVLLKRINYVDKNTFQLQDHLNRFSFIKSLHPLPEKICLKFLIFTTNLQLQISFNSCVFCTYSRQNTYGTSIVECMKFTPENSGVPHSH